MEVTSPSAFTILVIPACQNHLNEFIRMDAKISPKGIGIFYGLPESCQDIKREGRKEPFF